MGKISMRSVTSPTLSSGSFSIDFGEFESVERAIAMVNQGLGTVGNGLIFQTSLSISGNTVTVTILKADLEEATDADRDWEVAVTDDLNGKTVTVIAEGM